jgi:ribosomal protein S27AE
VECKEYVHIDDVEFKLLQMVSMTEKDKIAVCEKCGYVEFVVGLVEEE